MEIYKGKILVFVFAQRKEKKKQRKSKNDSAQQFNRFIYGGLLSQETRYRCFTGLPITSGFYSDRKIPVFSYPA